MKKLLLFASIIICFNGLLPQICFAQAGSLDNTFNQAGAGPNNYISTTAKQIDGKIIIGGEFTNYNTTVRNHIARLNTDGSIDDSFNPGLGFNSLYPGFHDQDAVHASIVQSDGKILIGGYFPSYNGVARNGIVRLNSNGNIDEAFDPGTGTSLTGQPGGGVLAIALQSDNKILIGGEFTSFNGTACNGMARLNTDGSLDASFVSGIETGSIIKTISIQSDGKIIAGGTGMGAAFRNIARLNNDGSIDPAFNRGITKQVLHPGEATESTINGIVFATRIQPDGKIIIGGIFSHYDNIDRVSITRLNADGTIDPTFFPLTVPNGTSGLIMNIYGLVLQPDGKIILGGTFDGFPGSYSGIVRLLDNGSIDNSFVSDGLAINTFSSSNEAIYSMLQQTDGKLIIGGSFTSYNGVSKNYLASIFTAPCTSTVAPTVAIAASPSGTICVNTPVTFTATPVNGGSSPSYQWQKNGINVGTNSNIYNNSTWVNGDIVTCALTSSILCASPATASSSLSITVSNVAVTPSVTIALTSGSNPVCAGEYLTFTATPVNGGTNPSYQWTITNFSYTINVGINSPTFTYNAFNNGDVVRCRLTNNDQCVSTANTISNNIPVNVTTTYWYLDADEDSYYTGAPVISCMSPGQGYTTFIIANGDCDDHNRLVHPNLAEIPGNGVDDNCNGYTDELYCIPAFVQSQPCTNMSVSNVTIGAINNSTGCSPAGYGDYSSLSTTAAAGSSVNCTITGTANMQTGNIYIDFNNDGDFNDAGETVTSNMKLVAGTPADVSFTIPASQTAGSYRVRIATGDAPTPCTGNQGETEDYTLVVTPYVLPPYCLPVIDYPCVYTWLENVTLGTIINNNTGCNSGYSDYSATHSTNVLPGETVGDTLKGNFGSPQIANIYVDYNNDHDFDDAGEAVATRIPIPFNRDTTWTFTVPATQQAGSYRVRIVTELDNPNVPEPTACHTSQGEVEDYTLTVKPVYCPHVVDNICTDDIYISKVVIGGINNPTDCNGRYSDYSTNYITWAAPLETVSYVFSGGFTSPQKFSMYIDYNNNGNFSDPGEIIASDVSVNAGENGGGTFVVPAGLASGSYRIRIVTDKDQNLPDPCHGIYGEAEDYTLSICNGSGPEINVKSNGISIIDGDNTPDIADNTDFGTVAPATEIYKTFTIENTGSALSISGISFTGPDASLFTVTSPPAPNLAQGETTQFTVQFMPYLGTTNAVMHINSDDCNEGDYDIALAANVICPASGPEITVLGNGTDIPNYYGSASFGDVYLNTQVTRTFTIQNNGNSTLTLSNAYIFGFYGTHQFTLTTPPSYSIAAGGSTTFTIQFTPNSIGQSSEYMMIFSDDCDESNYQFLVTGNGILSCTPTTSATNTRACGSYYWNGTPYTSSGTYAYHTTNAGGCDSTATLLLTIVNNSKPSTPAAISGPINVCPYIGTATATYSVQPIPTNVLKYRWTLPASVSVVSGTDDSSSITVNFAANFASGSNKTIKVKAIGCTGISADKSITLNAPPPPNPGTISITSTNACLYLGTGAEDTFRIKKVANATDYFWEVPTGAVIASHPGGTGVNDTIITVVFNSSGVAGKTISVFASTDCGNTSVSTTKPMTLTAPAIPGAITGPVDVCSIVISATSPTGTQAIYTIRKVPTASSYIWVVPPGAHLDEHPGGIGTVNDTIIKVTFSSSFTKDTIRVKAVNGCSTSSERKLTVSKLLPAIPGTIYGDALSTIAAITDVCPVLFNNSGPVTYAIKKVAKAVSYNWSLNGAGAVNATITHPNEPGINDTIILINYAPAFTSATLSVNSVSNCGSSNAKTCAISKKIPATPAVSGNGTPCPLSTEVYTASSSTGSTYTWTVSSSTITILSGQGTATLSVSFKSNFSSGNISVKAVSVCGTSSSKSFAVKKCNLAVVRIALPVAAKIENSTTDLTIYPNPSDGHFNIAITGTKNKLVTATLIEIVSEYGQLVYRNTINNSNGVIAIKMDGRLANGMYMVHCIINGERLTKRIFINR